jgi:hypothetical protein
MNACSSIQNGHVKLPTNQFILEMSQNVYQVRFKQINVQNSQPYCVLSRYRRQTVRSI